MRNALKPHAVTAALESCFLSGLQTIAPLSWNASIRSIASSAVTAQQAVNNASKKQGGDTAQQSLRTVLAFATFAGMGLAYHQITTSKAVPQKQQDDVASQTARKSGHVSDDPLLGMMMNTQPTKQRNESTAAPATQQNASNVDVSSSSQADSVEALTSKPWVVTEAWTEKLHVR